MAGLEKIKFEDLWNESEKRLAKEWYGQPLAPHLEQYRKRMENVTGRDAELFIMEVLVKGILLSRGELVEPIQ